MYRNYDIKPKKTVYGGTTFRSILEARWAIFFDELGVEYDYEFDVFNTRHGKYCPDFYLPNITIKIESYKDDNVCIEIEYTGVYVEIKPSKPTQTELEKLQDVANVSGKPCMFQVDRPSIGEKKWNSIHFPDGTKGHNCCFFQCYQCRKIGFSYDGKRRICEHKQYSQSHYTREIRNAIKRSQMRVDGITLYHPMKREAKWSFCGEKGCDGYDCVICTEIAIMECC